LNYLIPIANFDGLAVTAIELPFYLLAIFCLLIYVTWPRPRARKPDSHPKELFTSIFLQTPPWHSSVEEYASMNNVFLRWWRSPDATTEVWKHDDVLAERQVMTFDRDGLVQWYGRRPGRTNP
jgi:hypothetical protein